MPQPYLGPEHDLAQRLKNIEAVLAALSTQPVLLHASTGSDVGRPGLATDTNGLHVFNSAGTELITLASSDGSGTFSGNMTIAGNLTVVGGISNDNLQNPVVPLSVRASTANFGLTTANTLLINQTIAVPSGYTQALVMVSGNTSVLNNSGFLDVLYTAVTINGNTPGWQARTAVPNGSSGGQTRDASATLTGLGSSFTVQLYASTGSHSWATDSNNTGNLDGVVLFLR